MPAGQGYAKTRFVVGCLKHGMESKDWAGKQVVVPMPMTKQERKYSGCPHCNREHPTGAEQ